MDTMGFILALAKDMNVTFMVFLVVLIGAPTVAFMTWLTVKPNKLSHEEKKWEWDGKKFQLEKEHAQKMFTIERTMPAHIDNAASDARGLPNPMREPARNPKDGERRRNDNGFDEVWSDEYQQWMRIRVEG